MEWCESNYESYNTYKNRRNNTRAFVVELESQGKLTAGGLTEIGIDLNSLNSEYCYPFRGSAQITCGYGVGTSLGGQGYSGFKPHRGLDFGLEEGTQLYAVTDGIIESFDMPHSSTMYSGDDSKWYGNFCVIHGDDGNHILYCHMLETASKSGRIKKGEYIGLSGNTGNSSGAHLHFEVRTDTSYGTDINPAPLLGIQNIKLMAVNFN